MQDRPEAADLLDAVQELLMKEIMPKLEGDDGLSYKTLVSWNMLGIIARELRTGESLANDELARLQKILGENNSEIAATYVEKRGQIDSLNKKLVAKIRAEKISSPGNDIWEHVKQSAKEKLNVSNPRFSQD